MAIFTVLARITGENGKVLYYQVRNNPMNKISYLDIEHFYINAKHYFIENVEAVGTYPDNYSFTGTNGFKLKSLPTYKYSDFIKNDEENCILSMYDICDAQAAYCKAIIDRDKELIDSGSYRQYSDDEYKGIFICQVKNGKIGNKNWRTIQNLKITKLLVDGYDNNHLNVVGYGIKYSDGQGPVIDIPRISIWYWLKEKITLEPGKELFLNRAELAYLASDPRISFHFENCYMIIAQTSDARYRAELQPGKTEEVIKMLRNTNITAANFLKCNDKILEVVPLEVVDVKNFMSRDDIDRYFGSRFVNPSDKRVNVNDKYPSEYVNTLRQSQQEQVQSESTSSVGSTPMKPVQTTVKYGYKPGVRGLFNMFKRDK